MNFGVISLIKKMISQSLTKYLSAGLRIIFGRSE